MEKLIQKPRGTTDWYGKEYYQFLHLQQILTTIATSFGFERVNTPVFEDVKVYLRSLGATSDLVNKEFFYLQAKNDSQQYVLRPENTAAIMRMVANHKLLNQTTLPLKYFYLSPMYRYERPQAGRMREFWQFGLELINQTHQYEITEVILLANTIIQRLNLSDHVVLKLNYLGDQQTKMAWAQALQAHFLPYTHQLSALNQKRIHTNPIRILDDKTDQHLACVRNAPKISQFCSNEQLDQAQACYQQLTALNVAYVIDETLVRGFDYYQGLVFEFQYTGASLVGQNTLLGGGVYANILSDFGAHDVVSIGFGMGLERTLVALKEINFPLNTTQSYDLYVAALTDQAAPLMPLVAFLRKHHFQVVTNWTTTQLKKHFSTLKHINVQWVLIYGAKEATAQVVVFKNQTTHQSYQVALADYMKMIELMNKKVN